MSTRFLNEKKVRTFFRERHKQVTKEAIETIDLALFNILLKSVTTAKQFSRIQKEEIEFVCSSLLK
jgi:hypothetical protein